MKLNVSYHFQPHRETAHTALVKSLFGIDREPMTYAIANDLELPVREGDIVLFTGSSGSGKSSLLRATAAQLNDVLDLDSLDLGTEAIIDGLSVPFQDAMKLLSLCGLSEARLMLRTPDELSEGQRYRFRLAMELSRNPRWLLADEFTATLDRNLAKVVAFNLRKAASMTGTGCLLATAQEDILDDLQPNLLVRCEAGTQPRVQRGHIKKKDAVSGTNARSPPARGPTGNVSPTGTTGPTASDS